jgi:thiol-disulfide isomerase/thioredoxin
MNSKLKTVLGMAALVLVLAGAYLAYNALAKDYAPKIALTPSQTEDSNSKTGNSTAQKADNTAQDGRKTAAALDFTVKDGKGNTVKLSDFFGKPIVLNFWASWCPPCKAELPDFEKVYQEKKNDVIFVMVDLTDGQRETAEKGSQYISVNRYTFPVYYDTTQEAAYIYGISSIPTTLFIDKERNIITGQEGQISEALLRQGISMINP